MQNYLLVKLQKTILKIVKNQKIGKNLTAQLNNSESNIAQYLKENDEMTVIQKMLGKCRKLKGKLFDRRITKFMKISGGDNSRGLRQCVETNFEFSNCLQNKLLSKQLNCDHISRRNSKYKKIEDALKTLLR